MQCPRSECACNFDANRRADHGGGRAAGLLGLHGVRGFLLLPTRIVYDPRKACRAGKHHGVRFAPGFRPNMGRPPTHTTVPPVPRCRTGRFAAPGCSLIGTVAKRKGWTRRCDVVYFGRRERRSGAGRCGALCFILQIGRSLTMNWWWWIVAGLAAVLMFFPDLFSSFTATT